MRVYYAHCTSIFDSSQEERDLVLLRRMGWDVYNPNNEECSRGYEREGMEFFGQLLSSGRFDALVFRALPDGSIPAGVMSEINIAKKNVMPVMEIPSGLSRRGLSVDQTREYLREVGSR